MAERTGSRGEANGQPLHETAFASDPEHPCRTSRVAELLGGNLTGVQTPDAVSTDDLIRRAHSLESDTLPAGVVTVAANVIAPGGTIVVIPINDAT